MKTHLRNFSEVEQLHSTCEDVFVTKLQILLGVSESLIQNGLYLL